MIAARLTNDGELQLTGKIDTRSPIITDGLVAHFPMDNTIKGDSNRNLVDYSTWKVGDATDATGFALYGDSNSIVLGDGPFGESQELWQGLGNDVAADADGGFTTDWAGIPIDNTKLYRFSCWVKRVVQGDGSQALRCHGFGGATNGLISNDSSATTIDTNPLFEFNAWDLELDEWYLIVGHIFPHDNTVYGDHADSGWYSSFFTEKVKIISQSDFRWQADNTSTQIGCFIWASTLPETHQLMCYPRIDLCDGSEPTIEDLVNGEGNIFNSTSSTSPILTNDGLALEETTTNVIQDGDFTDGLQIPYATVSGNGVITIETDKETNNKVLKIVNPDATASYTNNYHGSSTYALSAAASGETWTISVEVKTITPDTQINMYLFGVDSAYLYNVTPDFTHIGVPIIQPEDEWQSFEVTRTFTVAEVAYITARLDILSEGTVFWRNWQLEKKEYKTEFVNGSRVGLGEINFNPDIVDSTKGTFVLEFVYNEYLYSAVSNLDLMDFQGAANNRFLILRKSANSLVPNKIYIRSGSTHYSSNIDAYLSATEKNILVYSWDTASGFSVYINNNKVRDEISFTESDLVPYNNIIFRRGLKFGFSVYNRRLIEEEIFKLKNSTHTINANGLITRSIRNYQELKADSHYFPFDMNGNNYYDSVEPVTDYNTEYGDKGVFISSDLISDLHLPYDIIDCKQNFTIYGWWFPTVAPDGLTFKPVLNRDIAESSIVNERLLIMNSGLSTSNLRIWLGSDGLTETILTNTTTQIATNEWNFFCMRRSGTSISLAIGNSINGYSIVSSETASYLDTDTLSAVWKVGAYSASHESDAYHRDYVFEQKALTNSEIETLFKRKLKATKDGIILQNGISTNITL